jgi:hypothetical protein
MGTSQAFDVYYQREASTVRYAFLRPREGEAAMDALSATLVSWHRILLAYAILMGLERPMLLLVAHYKRRPWYEQILAAAPTLAFFGLATAARSVQDTYDYWQSYMRFQVVYNPPEFAQHAYEDMSRAVADVTRLGWTLYALTVALLIVGWIFLLRWLPLYQQAAAAKGLAASAQDVWSRWRLHLQRAAGIQAQPVTADSDELEITIESIDPRRPWSASRTDQRSTP